MNFWFANIKIDMIEKIEKASKESEVDFRKGSIMTSTDVDINEKGKKEEKFYILFCKNSEDAKKILIKYFEIIGEKSRFYLEHKEYFIDRMIGGRI